MRWRITFHRACYRHWWRLPAPSARTAASTFGPVVVPAGRYLVMGDNRDNSFDSRYFGFVPRSEILGQATRVVASVDPARSFRPRFERFMKALE